MLQRLDLRGSGPDLRGLLPRPNLAGEGPVAEVRAIVDDVRARGDGALREYTLRFDGVGIEELRVPAEEIAAALDTVDPELLAAAFGGGVGHRGVPPAPAGPAGAVRTERHHR